MRNVVDKPTGSATTPLPGRVRVAGGRARAVTIALLVLAVLAVVSLCAALLLLPTYIVRRAVAEAAARGVAMTVDEARMGVGAVHLSGVAFRIGAIPQVSGRAAEVDVELRALTPRFVDAREVDLSIDGPIEEVGAATDAWLASLAGAPGSTIEALRVVSGRATWTRAFGMSATIDASGLTGESDARGAAMRFVAESARVSLAPAPRAVPLGPWRVTFERDAATARGRVELDPAVRDGASVLWVESRATGATSLKVGIPRSPLARIGVPPAALGLSTGEAPEVEAAIDLERPTLHGARLDATLTLHGARLGGAPTPVDVHLDLGAAGDPEGPLDVSRGAMTVGPLKAKVAGTVRLYPDGAHVALSWRTDPMACSALAVQLAGQSPLGAAGASMGAGLGTIGQALGLAKVTGEAHAAGLLTLDTRNIEGSQATVTQKNTCGVTIFP